MNIHFLNSFYLAEDKLIQQNIENIILNEFLMGSDVYSLFPEERYTQYFCYDNELIAVVFFKIKDTACYHVTVHKTYSFKENDYLKIKVCELLGACVVDLSEFIVGGGVKLQMKSVRLARVDWKITGLPLKLIMAVDMPLISLILFTEQKKISVAFTSTLSLTMK